jgi:AraC family transcriptional regulator of adaptative response / DNA-3-methyladenine glycosylase II
VHEDFDRCYRAVQSKDPRFDGWFFTAVTSTGIYCRPSCPALTPKAANVRFYPTAAGAQQAGFRACKRCRPDASPGSPEWDIRADAVGRAMRLIADGVVDRDGVPGLASRLGYSPRQVERLLVAGVGAAPLALARAQRAQAARILIETTDLPMAQVAFGAGFASIRQFNDTVRQVFDRSPTELRRRRLSAASAATGALAAGAAAGPAATGTGTVHLRLPFRLPLWPDNLFGHLAATAVPGVEEIRGGAYRRTLRLPHGPGIVALRPTPDHIACTLSLADLRDLSTAVARCRRLLDLDADPEAVDAQLGADAGLGPLVAKAPGRRVPRCVDEEEMAIRVVLGQQVSTAAARTHAARLAAAHGEDVVDPAGGLTRLFPCAASLVGAAGPAGPRARQACLAGVADALASGRLALGPGCDWDRARAGLAALAGCGPWTIEMVAMRALGDPDAFPSADLGVRRGAAAAGLATSERALAARAAAWRPWRAYAVAHLWGAQGDDNHWPAAEAGPRKDAA